MKTITMLCLVRQLYIQYTEHKAMMMTLATYTHTHHHQHCNVMSNGLPGHQS